jgi:hypothetical protein
MSWCLRDRRLVLLYYGEASPKHRAHLDGCPLCQARYQQLVHDLDTIRQTLQDAPLPVGVRPRAHPARVSWLPAAVVVAMLCTILLGGAWLWRPSPQRQPDIVWHAEVVQFLERHVTPALFGTTDTQVAMMPEPVSTSLYLQAALEGGWDCTGQEAFFSPECENYPFALLVEEP